MIEGDIRMKAVVCRVGVRKANKKNGRLALFNGETRRIVSCQADEGLRQRCYNEGAPHGVLYVKNVTYFETPASILLSDQTHTHHNFGLNPAL